MKNSIVLCFIFISLNLAQAQILSFPAVKDAWLWSHPSARAINFRVANSQNQGLNNVTRVESWQWIQNRNDTIRSLIDFDIDSLKPYANSISKATLVLRFFANVNFTQQVGNNAFEVYVANETWQEATVNWLNKPRYDASVMAQAPQSQSDTQSYFIDVTSLITHYLNTNGEGLYLKLQNEMPFNGLTFASREHSNVALRPVLRVEMGGTIGLEKTYSKIKFNNPITDQLKIETGNNTAQKLQLIDSSGKTIIEDSIQQSKSFNTSALPRGIYFLRIGSDEYRLVK